MNDAIVHHMDTELITDRQTMRYTCAQCHRCVEDGPEGLRLIHKGDVSVAHSGGQFAIAHLEFEPVPQERPTLH
jgi:hypothetical protein